MGIAGFFRWVSDKYPLLIQDVIQSPEETETNNRRNPNPNPNGEFDNLYLDMNGIIHPCFHPEDGPAPQTLDQVFRNVYAYIDHIISMIRPRKILYMALDGVAPRVKMNQQRVRRFRAAKEAEQKQSETGEEDFIPTNVTSSEVSDSNVITPGTEFMQRLAMALRSYIKHRISHDAKWRDLKVILSDSNVAGEGEHKIMAFIRHQQGLPDYDHQTRHCMYGLDADLIMLALATHEQHFSILREKVTLNKPNAFNNSYTNYGYLAQQSIAKGSANYTRKPFQLLQIWNLREHLKQELCLPLNTNYVDFERIIDDFVLMCFFMGNDFLPHMPSLPEIRDGGIDMLLHTYKTQFWNIGGYLTEPSGKVNLSRLEYFIKCISSNEYATFNKKNSYKYQNQHQIRNPQAGRDVLPARKYYSNYKQYIATEYAPYPNYKQQKPIGGNGYIPYAATARQDRFKLRDTLVQWKQKYYSSKFGADTPQKIISVQKSSVASYLHGLCWVLYYYYQGVCSWQWFYPYHYAPFGSDMIDLDKIDINFTLGKPLKPLEQLMAVLPAASGSALPKHYRTLMTDPNSPIIDFYPNNFEVDMEGKRHAWQGIAKLMFIDESRLLQETRKLETTLSIEEQQRNSLAEGDLLYFRDVHGYPQSVVYGFNYHSHGQAPVNTACEHPMLTYNSTDQHWSY